MRYSYLLFFVTTLLFSCKKDYEPTKEPTSGPQAPTVLLKDLVASHLPEPYYHFEYDAAGKVIVANFASGFTMYQVVYVNGRISEMRNNSIVNKDRLQYFYDYAGRVNAIRYADSTGLVYTRIQFEYDAQKLIKLVREKKIGTNFMVDKMLTMSYYPDGNLMDLAFHYPSINGVAEINYSERYEQYDNKINADGFDLLHTEFFDHLVLLPGVQLQKNNPKKVSHTGDGINFTVDYSYTYNNKDLPLIKSGTFTHLNGPDAGKKVQISSTFSYY